MAPRTISLRITSSPLPKCNRLGNFVICNFTFGSEVTKSRGNYNYHVTHTTLVLHFKEPISSVLYLQFILIWTPGTCYRSPVKYFSFHHKLCMMALTWWGSFWLDRVLIIPASPIPPIPNLRCSEAQPWAAWHMGASLQFATKYFGVPRQFKTLVFLVVISTCLVMNACKAGQHLAELVEFWDS